MTVGHLAGDAGGGDVELVGPLGDAVLAERDGEERPERGRLDHVDADLEEGVVHPGDDVGPGDDEHLVAALEGLAAEVVRAQPEHLHVGAEGAVVDDDPLDSPIPGTSRVLARGGVRPGRLMG